MPKKSVIVGMSVLGLSFLLIINSGMPVYATETTSVKSLLPSAGIGEVLISDMTDNEYVEAAKQAEGSFWGYTNLGICNTQDNNLNIRKTPEDNGSLAGKLPKFGACEILGIEGEWTYIKSGEVEGYVSSVYLLTDLEAKLKANEVISTVATVTADALKVREKPNTDCPVITQVPKGEELEYVETLSDGWVKVMMDDEEVYVSGEYIQIEEKLATAITMTELLYGQGVSNVRVDLCQYAKQFLGNPYRWGGTSLTKGADCSGFVMSVFKNFGVSLPHSSRAQANSGTKISASQAQPGDLFFYSNGGGINHVAIYIGGGQVIHASSPKTGIRISSCNYRTPVKIVRILQD